MKKLLETLETLKPKFLKELNYLLFMYTHTKIGSGTTDKSPMWMQMDSIWGDVELKFTNSQDKSVAFYIPATEEQQQFIKGYRDECYDYFKYVKYTYIRDNYPTVWDELTEGLNGNRINNFISSYKLAA
jgi:hypothetical protein